MWWGEQTENQDKRPRNFTTNKIALDWLFTDHTHQIQLHKLLFELLL